MANEAQDKTPPDLGNYMGIPITAVHGRLGDTNQAIADYLEVHPEVNTPGEHITWVVRTVVGPHTITPKEGDNGQEITTSEVFKATSACPIDDKKVAGVINKWEAQLLAHQTGNAPTLEGTDRKTGRRNNKADEAGTPALGLVE